MAEIAHLAENLRNARVKSGLSQQAAAEAMGMPRTGLTNIEGGIRNVSLTELTKFAELYHVSIVSLLKSSTLEDGSIALALPRAMPEMSKSAYLDEVLRLTELWQEGWHLKEALGKSLHVEVPFFEYTVNSTHEAIQQGESTAEKERQRLKLGVSPLGNIPEILSNQGIWASTVRFDEEALSGIFLGHSSFGLAVVVNCNHGYERQRFSFCHEYAHALFDRNAVVRVTTKHDSKNLIEKRANAFAAAFLMPSEGISDVMRSINKGQRNRSFQVVFNMDDPEMTEAELRNRSGSQQINFDDIALMARRFGVSYDAMIWRLRNLNYLTFDEAKNLLSQREFADDYRRLLGYENSGSLEGGSCDQRELRGQIMSLALDAFRQEIITKEHLFRLAERIDIQRGQLAFLI